MLDVRVRINASFCMMDVRVRIDISCFMVYVRVRSPRSQRTVEG